LTPDRDEGGDRNEQDSVKKVSEEPDQVQVLSTDLKTFRDSNVSPEAVFLVMCDPSMNEL
jgi:hypothetical protein